MRRGVFGGAGGVRGVVTLQMHCEAPGAGIFHAHMHSTNSSFTGSAGVTAQYTISIHNGGGASASERGRMRTTSRRWGRAQHETHTQAKHTDPQPSGIDNRAPQRGTTRQRAAHGAPVPATPTWWPRLLAGQTLVPGAALGGSSGVTPVTPTCTRTVPLPSRAMASASSATSSSCRGRVHTQHKGAGVG
jgi:hypothetical protein